MPFDRGRMDDPNPSAFEQFDAAVARRGITVFPDEEFGFQLLALINETGGLIVEKFADWCYDQGFAEGVAEGGLEHEQER